MEEDHAEHCGACFHSCLDAPGVDEASCSDGRCSLQCAEGYGDCDADPDNGCEVDLGSDLRHCGVCGRDCMGSAQVEEAVCVQGSCHVLRCVDGWQDCDHDPENGCEVDLDSDVKNCGACGADCAALPNSSHASACIRGVCRPGCNEGFLDCDGDPWNGCEVDLRRDEENCGACNERCHVGERCIGGRCVDTEYVQWRLPSTSTPGPFLLADGAAFDETTGLTWQRQGVVTVEYEAADATCRGLSLDDGNDWRLPTFVELSSIVDLRAYLPAVDESVFFVRSDAYWTATSYVGTADDRVFLIDLATGQSMLRAREAEAGFLCVRGGSVSDEARAVVGEEVVEDRVIGRMWQRRVAPRTMTWADAVAYCETLRLGGFSDWRLPTRREIESIADRRLYGPAIDREIYPDTPTITFWTSDDYVADPMNAWVSHLDLGSVSFLDKSHASAVRCIRTL